MKKIGGLDVGDPETQQRLSRVVEALRNELADEIEAMSLDITKPADVQRLARYVVAQMYGVPEENVLIEHAVILDDQLHVRGAVRMSVEYIEISISEPGEEPDA